MKDREDFTVNMRSYRIFKRNKNGRGHWITIRRRKYSDLRNKYPEQMIQLNIRGRQECISTDLIAKIEGSRLADKFVDARTFNKD